MLRIRRLNQLLIALCGCAFVSAYISLVIHRILETTALPWPKVDLVEAMNQVQDIGALKNLCTPLVGAAFELRDNSAFLASWGLWFVFAWSVILGLVALLLYREIQRSIDAPRKPEHENIIDLALAGRLELRKAFWGFYVGAYLALVLAMRLLVKPVGLELSPLGKAVFMPMAMSVPVVLCFASAIAAWRCAPNTSRTLWRYLARTIVLLFTLAPVLGSLLVFGRTAVR